MNSAPTPRPKLGVAVPLANEEDNISRFLDEVLVHLQPHDRVFCVLDNICRDRTKTMVEERGKTDPRVVLVWSPQNRCVVDAYFAGYRAAMADGCEWILEMDGGFSHLPSQMPQHLELMAHGYDYVGGSRYLPGGQHHSPITRIIVSRGGSVLAQCVLSAKMTDMTSGFECFNRKAMEIVLTRGVRSRANFFQTEIKMMMHDLRWKEVPITYTNANYAVGRSSIREALRILFRLRAERKANRPKT